MDPSAIERCQQITQHVFQDPRLLEQALTHASISQTRLQSNERLEFLGDAVLALVVCQELFQTQADFLEGEMTKIKSAVVSGQTCAIIARKLGLSDELLLGKGVASAERLPQSVGAAVFEAVIGAIYLDGGLEPARRFVLEHVRPYIAAAAGDTHQRNYKSILQQHVQRSQSVTPEYQLLDEKGPDHSKAFEVAVTVAGRHFPGAWGITKKDAEQAAARRALEEMGLLEEPAKESPP